MTNPSKYKVINRETLRNAPSLLKGTILPASSEVFSRIRVLVDVIEANEETHPTAPADCRPYLVLDEYVEARQKVQASRLVRRDCHDHLLPLVIHGIATENRCVRGLCTGTLVL